MITQAQEAFERLRKSRYYHGPSGGGNPVGPSRQEDSDLVCRNLESIADMIEALEDLVLPDSSGVYETEYDGRMYTMCAYCNYQEDIRPNHHESCAIIKGRSALEKAGINGEHLNKGKKS